MKRKESAHERRCRIAHHDRFRETVLESGPCWFNELWPHPCDGPMDPCHLLDAQYLRHQAELAGLEPDDLYALVYDPRNGIPGCRSYHHRFDNGFIRIYQPQLPAAFFYFVADWEERLEAPGRLIVRVDKQFPKEVPHGE